MKKVILLLSITMFSFVAIQAQGNIRFGIAPGLSLAKTNLKGAGADDDIKHKLGFDGGIFAEFGVSKYFSIQPEINFAMHGFKVEEGGEEGHLAMNYITVPVLAKVKPTAGLNIFAGPQIGFLLKAETEAGGTTQDLKDQLKSTDFFAVFGAEYQFPMGFLVGFRYNLGLTDVVDVETTTEIRNRNWAFRVGYSFPLGGTARKK